MKGPAQALCAFIVLATVLGALAEKPKKHFKKVPPPQLRNQGPPGGPGGPPFLPPLQLPPIPPFGLETLKQSSSVLDPYACLPKYLCIIQDKKGEKRTTIVHGLHPALRKAKPNVIDPSTLPKLTPGGTKPFSPPFVTEDEEVFRDREFNDSFLKQQEVAETMAFIEEKRRQFMYQQGLKKQKIIPKDGEEEVVEGEDKQSKESKEEEEEKSQEASKEDKEEETEKSAELSKEEEKEEPEEESVERDVSSESSAQSSAQSGAKLSKYKIKKKAYATKMRNNAFKSRMDDYEDADLIEDHLATVPWDDRIKNDSDPLKPKEIYDKLFGKVLPFQLPSLPKIARNIPGMSFLASNSDEEVTTTTTQRPGIFKRMFKTITGSGSGSPPTPLRKRYGKPMRRYKRDAETNLKLLSNDAKIVKQIRDPARQCRMIYKGCDLPYDHIMKMVSTGQVLIENDNEDSTTKKPAPVDPTVAQDDEAEQAVRDKMAPKKSKPIPQMLAQAHLGGKKKVIGPTGLPIFGKNKNKPAYGGSLEYTDAFQRPKPKKPIASLPLLPMRYQWGKPTYTVHGRPTYSNGPPDFSGGYMNPAIYNKQATPPTTTVPTTTTTERPIFAAAPLDKKNNFSIPYQHSVIKLNRTHAVHVLKKKPYNPGKTRTRDDKGRPVSFSTVFTEIAGNSGGIHDFFDRISGAFGGEGLRESGREFPSAIPASNSEGHKNPDRLPYSFHSQAKPTAFPSAPIPPDHKVKQQDDEPSAEQDEEEGSDEEEGDEGTDDQEEDEEGGDNNDQEDEEGGDNNDQEDEEGGDNNDQEDEEEEEADIADEIGEGEAATQPKQPPKQPIVGQPELEGVPFDQKKPNKDNNKKKPQPEEGEEEEDDEEEPEDDDEDELNLPDNIPPFIRQSMIEDHKRKKLEKEQGGGGEGGQQQQGGPQPGGLGGRPGAPPGGPGGRPGAPPGGPGGRPGAPGGFGRPSQGGGLFGSSQQGPSQSQGGGGLFSFLG